MSETQITDAEINAAVGAEAARNAPPQPAPANQPTGQEAAPANNNEEEGQGGEQTEPKFQPWEERRIARFTRQMREQERAFGSRIHDLEQQLAAARGGNQQPPQETRPQPPGQSPQSREAIEAQVRSELTFNQNTHKIAGALAAANLNVQEATRGLMDVGLDWNNPEHRELIGDISELPNPAQVYYALGTNRDHAAHLLELSPRAQARELMALSARLANGTQSAPQQRQAVPTSSAPRPAGSAPRGGSAATPNIMDPNLGWDQFKDGLDKLMSKR